VQERRLPALPPNQRSNRLRPRANLRRKPTVVETNEEGQLPVTGVELPPISIEESIEETVVEKAIVAEPVAVQDTGAAPAQSQPRQRW